MKTDAERKEMYAKWAQERADSKRARINEIKEELKQVMLQDTDLDTITDIAFSTILQHDRKLTDADIVEICDVYFNKNRTNKQLYNSDTIYQQLHRANDMIITLGEPTVNLHY